MDGVGPEAQPPGVPGEGKARRLTLLPACPTSAVSSILGTWLDQYSEDFCQPPDFPCLRQLVAYVQLNMPGSDLERRAHLLLAQLEHVDLGEAEPEGEEGGVGTGHGGAPSAELEGEEGGVGAGHGGAPLAELEGEEGGVGTGHGGAPLAELEGEEGGVGAGFGGRPHSSCWARSRDWPQTACVGTAVRDDVLLWVWGPRLLWKPLGFGPVFGKAGVWVVSDPSAAPDSSPESEVAAAHVRGRSQARGQRGQGGPRACVRLQLERSLYRRLQSGADTSAGSISSSAARRGGHSGPPRGQLPARTFLPLPCDGAFCLQFSRSVVSDSLQTRGLQHARPPCPSPTPRVYPN